MAPPGSPRARSDPTPLARVGNYGVGNYGVGLRGTGKRGKRRHTARRAQVGLADVAATSRGANVRRARSGLAARTPWGRSARSDRSPHQRNWRWHGQLRGCRRRQRRRRDHAWHVAFDVPAGAGAGAQGRARRARSTAGHPRACRLALSSGCLSSPRRPPRRDIPRSARPLRRPVCASASPRRAVNGSVWPRSSPCRIGSQCSRLILAIDTGAGSMASSSRLAL
jgi:hypothetical protein